MSKPKTVISAALVDNQGKGTSKVRIDESKVNVAAKASRNAEDQNVKARILQGAGDLEIANKAEVNAHAGYQEENDHIMDLAAVVKRDVAPTVPWRVAIDSAHELQKLHVYQREDLKVLDVNKLNQENITSLRGGHLDKLVSYVEELHQDGAVQVEIKRAMETVKNMNDSQFTEFLRFIRGSEGRFQRYAE